MKSLIIILSLAFALSACSKKEYGVCYCKFFSGDKSEYDLSHLTRQEQKDQCDTHNTNAAFFAGDCKLE